MNKSSFAGAIARELGIEPKEAASRIDTLFGTISDTLAEGGRVEIRDFGVFEVRDYKAYTGRNPRARESILVNAKKMPFFKQGRNLKKLLNNK